MTDNEFNLTMIGQGQAHCTHNGQQTRLRYIVADAFDQLASEKHRAGRPDRAGLCRHIATQLRTGNYPSKRTTTKAKHEIANVQARIIDGVSLTGR